MSAGKVEKLRFLCLNLAAVLCGILKAPDKKHDDGLQDFRVCAELVLQSVILCGCEVSLNQMSAQCVVIIIKGISVVSIYHKVGGQGTLQ